MTTAQSSSAHYTIMLGQNDSISGAPPLVIVNDYPSDFIGQSAIQRLAREETENIFCKGFLYVMKGYVLRHKLITTSSFSDAIKSVQILHDVLTKVIHDIDYYRYGNGSTMRWIGSMIEKDQIFVVEFDASLSRLRREDFKKIYDIRHSALQNLGNVLTELELD